MKTFLPLLFALIVITLPARAEDVLEIPESCGSAAELTREVEALRASTHSTLHSERPPVRIKRDGEGYLLTVELPDGRRSLRDPDCRALFRAAIVIAALGHESSVENVLEASEAKPAQAERRAEAAPPAEEKRTQPTDLTPEPAQREPEDRPRSRRPPRVRVPYVYPRKLSARALMRAELMYGVVPELSGTFGAGVALEYARIAGRASVAYHGPPRVYRSQGEGVQVQAISGSLTLELVALPWLRPGLGIDVYALHGRGRGGLTTRSDWAVQTAPHVSFALRMLQQGPFWLELSARALWAPKPAKFNMTGRDPVYRTSPWGLAGGIYAGYQFL